MVSETSSLTTNMTIIDTKLPINPQPFSTMMSESALNLNILEQAWVSWYNYVGNDYLATGIFFFCMHETVYFGRSLIWMSIERIPQFRKYKIQEVCFTSHILFRKLEADSNSKKRPPKSRNGAV